MAAQRNPARAKGEVNVLSILEQTWQAESPTLNPVDLNRTFRSRSQPVMRLLAAAAIHRIAVPPYRYDELDSFFDYAEGIKTKKHSAAGFGSFVLATSRLEEGFRDSYGDLERPDMPAILDLCDRTDEQWHPVLGILPSAATFTEGPRRTNVIWADRLLRHTVDLTIQIQSRVQ